jgi:hypothetical protein
MKRNVRVFPPVMPQYNDLYDWNGDDSFEVDAEQYLFPRVAEKARKVKHNIMEIETDAGSRYFAILEVDMPVPSMRIEQEKYLAGEESKNCLIVVEIAEQRELLAMTLQDVYAVLNGTEEGGGAKINILPRKSVRVMAKYGDVIPLLDQFDQPTIWDWHTSTKKVVPFKDRLCGEGPFKDPATCLLRCTDSKELSDPVTRIKVAEQKLVFAISEYFEALWLWPDGSRVDDMEHQCRLATVSNLVREANDAKTHAFQQNFMQHLAYKVTEQKDQDELEEVCHDIDKDRRNILGHVGLQMHFVKKQAPLMYDFTKGFTDRMKFVQPLTHAAGGLPYFGPEPFSPPDEVAQPAKKPRT